MDSPTEQRICLLDLPNETIVELTRYLRFSDTCALSNSCDTLSWLKDDIEVHRIMNERINIFKRGGRYRIFEETFPSERKKKEEIRSQILAKPFGWEFFCYYHGYDIGTQKYFWEGYDSYGHSFPLMFRSIQMGGDKMCQCIDDAIKRSLKDMEGASIRQELAKSRLDHLLDCQMVFKGKQKKYRQFRKKNGYYLTLQKFLEDYHLVFQKATENIDMAKYLIFSEYEISCYDICQHLMSMTFDPDIRVVIEKRIQEVEPYVPDDMDPPPKEEMVFAPIENPDKVNPWEREGEDPLRYAVTKKDWQKAAQLVRDGADPTLLSKNHQKKIEGALITAADNNNYRTAQNLFKLINFVNNDRLEMALNVAAADGRWKIVALFANRDLNLTLNMLQSINNNEYACHNEWRKFRYQNQPKMYLGLAHAGIDVNLLLQAGCQRGHFKFAKGKGKPIIGHLIGFAEYYGIDLDLDTALMYTFPQRFRSLSNSTMPIIVATLVKNGASVDLAIEEILKLPNTYHSYYSQRTYPFQQVIDKMVEYKQLTYEELMSRAEGVSEHVFEYCRSKIN